MEGQNINPLYELKKDAMPYDEATENDILNGTAIDKLVLSSTLKGVLDKVMPVKTIAQLRILNIAGCISISICDKGKEGVFSLDLTDTISLDNGATVIIDSLSRRWKRDIKENINILWFGAKGNGLNDDTIFIQNCIDENNGKKIVFFPEGDFVVSELNIPSNTILSGSGKSSVLTVTGTGNIFSVSGKSFVKVENLFFKGNNSSTTTTNGNGIFVQNSTFITIKDCFFDGFGSNNDTGAGGIFITHTTDSFILNNTINNGIGEIQGSDISSYSAAGKSVIMGNKCYSRGNSNGININNINPKGNVIVMGNFCDNHTRHGIICAYGGTTQVENSIISNNICTNNASTGIYCNTNTHGFIISNNIIESCSGGGRNGYDICGGISVIGNGSKIVTNNYIANTGKDLLGNVRTINPATGDSNDPTRCTAIRNNKSKNTLIHSNIINGCTGSGITLYLQILQASLKGNQIDNCNKYAIVLNATCIANQTKIEIKNNLIDQSLSDGHGIYMITYLLEDNVDISGNYLRGAKAGTSKFGLHIEGIGAKGKIIGNNIDNFDVGLDIGHPTILEKFGKQLFFENNTISNCTKGMFYLSSANNFSFHQNTYFVGNLQDQHNPYGYVTFVKSKCVLPFKECYLENPPTFGFWNKCDVVHNTNPVAGGYLGWTCITEGTPGTWKGFSLIQA